MGHIEPRQGKGSESVATAKQASKPFPDERDLAHDIGAHSGRKVGLLIPGKQVAGEAHGQNKKGKQRPRNPKQFSPPFKRPPEKGLQEVQGQHNDHCARAVVVQAAQERPCRHLLGDIGNAGVRRLGGGNIVERKGDTGNDLGDKDEEQSGTEDVGQACTAGDRLIQRCLHYAAQAGTLVKPTIDAGWQAFRLRAVGLHWIFRLHV